MDPRIRQLYKTLVYMGKDYPEKSGGYSKFIKVLKENFVRTQVNNDVDLNKALKKGDYVIKGRLPIRRTFNEYLLTQDRNRSFILFD